MQKYTCPLSETAVSHIETLAKCYKLAVDAACNYNNMAFADKKQMEKALCLADHIAGVIECYLSGWENCAPCLNYACGWEICKNNLEILRALPNINDLPIKNPPNFNIPKVNSENGNKPNG